MNVQNQPPLPRAPHPRPALTQLVPPFAARPTADRVWRGGGAWGERGCTTIRMSARDRYADAGRGLPVSADPRLPSRVVLCAMCTGRGLEALRALLADWNAGLFGQTILMGVAVHHAVAEDAAGAAQGRAPGRSAAPALWRLPFIRGLDLDGFPETYPRAYARMLADLEAGGKA